MRGGFSSCGGNHKEHDKKHGQHGGVIRLDEATEKETLKKVRNLR